MLIVKLPKYWAPKYSVLKYWVPKYLVPKYWVLKYWVPKYTVPIYFPAFVCMSCSHKVPLYVNFTYIVEVQIFLVVLNCTLCKKTPHSQSNNMSQGFSSFLLSFAFSQKYLRGDLIEFSNIVTWNTGLMLTKLFLKQRVFFQDLTSLVTSKYLSLNHIDNIERADLLIWVYLHSYGST